MYARVLWGKLKLGKWDEYERHYRESVLPVNQTMKGYRGRRLLRNLQNPDEGITVSFWDTKEDMEAYSASPERQTIAKAAEALYTGEYWVKEFEIRSIDEV